MRRRSTRSLSHSRGSAIASIQTLEQRVLPAGNVSVRVNGSDVTITGDSRANLLEITGDGAGGLIITGLEGTTINLGEDFTIDEEVGSLKVSLGSGNDFLSMLDVDLAGGLTITGGPGTNEIWLETIIVAENASITGSSRGDVIAVLDSIFESDLAIKGGVRNDVVGLGVVEVGGSLTVNLGKGSDHLAISEVTVQGSSKITANGGADVSTIFDSTFLGAFKYEGSTGAEQLLIGTSIFESEVTVAMGSQKDLLSLREGNDFQESASFTGGKGLDTIDGEDSSDFAERPEVLLFENTGGLDDEDYDALLEEITEFLDEYELGDLVGGGGGEAEVSLQTDISQLLAGTSEIVLFQAVVDSDEPATAVNLHLATDTGAAGTFLLPLFDDGSALHGDAVAGDGVFSNTLAVQIDAPGVQTYVTVTEFANLDDILSLATLTAVAAPNEETLQARIDLADEVQSLIDGSLEQGQTLAQAIAAAADLLANDPSVLPGSIETTSASIFWQSIEGILFAAFGNEIIASGEERHGGGSSAATNTPATTLSPAVNSHAAAEEEEFCGEAIVLAPYAWQFEPWDESDEIATMLDQSGIDVRQVRNTTQGAQSVTLNDFRDLRQYESIVITSHGDSSNRYGTLLMTGDTYTTGELLANLADIITGRVALTNGSFSITPRFISRYAGSLNDSIVYVGSCRSAFNSTLANAFLGQGAAAFVGYTDYVGSSFANTRGQSLFTALLDEQEVGHAPGINFDRETDNDPARYVMFGDHTAKLPNECYLLNDWDLYVEYKWPLSVRDLDTSTHFLGGKAGYACGVGPYLNWSGDDTSAGGTETVIVDLDAAFDAGQWDDVVTSALHAGWYIPAGGSGPASLTVGLRNQTTGEIKEVTSRAISPGAQTGCAATVVGTVSVTVEGEGDDATITYTLA